MNNVMLDIETLGVTPGAIILSIGAVEFDESNLGDVFHMGINYEDCVRHGMHVDASTAMWWLSQEDAAQAAVLNITSNALGLRQVLVKFSEAFKDWKTKKLWCNGAAFDIPIMSAAHKKVDMIVPWRYSNEMDMRTIKGCIGKATWDCHRVAPTVAHDGLADAISQAITLQRSLRACGLEEWLK